MDEVVEHLKARASEGSFVFSSKYFDIFLFYSIFVFSPLAFKAKAAAAIPYVKRQKVLSKKNCEKLKIKLSYSENCLKLRKKLSECD